MWQTLFWYCNILFL